MIRLENTEKSGPGYRHRTWTSVGEGARQVSALQNQFALYEHDLSEEEAVQQYRRWLWQEMQDPYNVVWREMSELVNAHEQGQDVEVLVPRDAPHGAVLVRALLWMAENTSEVRLPQTRSSEPGPCHEPILPDGVLSTPAEIQAKHLVWVSGRTQSRIGVICGYGQAFVPEYGIVPLRNFRWIEPGLAQSLTLQQLLNDALDEAFEVEADAEPVAYNPEPGWSPENRFDESADWFWEQTEEEKMASDAALVEAGRDALTLAKQLYEETEEWEAAKAVAQAPEVENWYYKRPPLSGIILAENVQPAYRHRGEDSPLLLRSVEDQMDDLGWRYANREETEAFLQTFQSQKSCPEL